MAQGAKDGEVAVDMPVSEEALGVNFRELGGKVAAVEGESQVQGLDEQMMLKSGEISAKEAYLHHIRDCADRIQRAKSEHEFLLTDFQVSVATEATNVLAHVKDMQNREESIRETLTEALVESQVIEKTVKKAKNRLIEELNRTVEKAMKEAKGEIEMRGKLYELDFTLELGLIRLSLDLIGKTELDTEENVRGELQRTEGTIGSSEEALREVVSAVVGLVAETEGRGTAFAQSYQQAQATEKAALLAVGKGEFEYRLEAGIQAISKLVFSIETRQSLLLTQLKRLEEASRRLAKGTDLPSKVTRTTTRLHSSSQALLTEAELQANKIKAACEQAVKTGTATHTPNPSNVTPNSHSTPGRTK